ncbi:unnamed protein product [Penicillium nalgiovense]|nr:unnamed protein product [Penicillium nalgiovense]
MDSLLAETQFIYHGFPTKSTDTETCVDSGKAQDEKAEAEADRIKSLVRTFLEDIGFDRSIRINKDHEMKVAVWQHFKSLDLGEKIENSIQKTLDPSVDTAYHGYTSLPFQVRVLAAIQFMYMFLLDDVAVEFLEDLEALVKSEFTLNQPHQHPLFTGLDSHLRNLSHYYGPYCHSVITKCMLDYTNGTVVEFKMYKASQSNFKPSPDLRLMPMYLRTKIGGAEILLHLLFPNSVFPEEEYVMQYFPVTLELKEFCVGDEQGLFVANLADTHYVQHLDILQYLTNYTPGVTYSAYKQLRNSPSLLAVVKNFMQGMIMLFTAHRRYHLVELFADEQYLLPYDTDA